ncbi:MAG: Uma2 family endonuclease [Myxococcota bacterium]
MPASARHHVHTLADYFAVERSSRHKHEFLDGQIFLMAGGTPRHNYVAQRVLDALSRALAGGPCFTMPADQRLATPDGLYTYADGSVFCGAVEVGAEQTALNPTLVVEVLSDSTRAYDRADKLDRYRTIPSLQHVVLIETDAVDVEVWSRTGDGWQRRVAVDREATVALDALGIELPVQSLYEGVDRISAPAAPASRPAR